MTAVTDRLAAVRTWLTAVDDVEEVHPRLRRITFAGGDLAAFAPLGPDTFLYVLAAPAGIPSLPIDRSFTWEAYRQMPEQERPVGAYYTVRRWDPSNGRLTMLVVLHGDAGRGSAWARRARPGEPVALWGPRSSFDPPAGTAAFLLLADETGLPAAAAIIESLPPSASIRLVAEVADAGACEPMPAHDGLEVTWCHRDGAEAGTTPLLADAVRARPPASRATYVWGGAESRTITAVRRYLRGPCGLPPRQLSLVAYWQHASHRGDDR